MWNTKYFSSREEAEDWMKNKRSKYYCLLASLTVIVRGQLKWQVDYKKLRRVY